MSYGVKVEVINKTSKKVTAKKSGNVIHIGVIEPMQSKELTLELKPKFQWWFKPVGMVVAIVAHVIRKPALLDWYVNKALRFEFDSK